MKKNEIIELNGEEYTLELNRDSIIQIDKLCDINKTMNIINRDFYTYIDEEEISDDFDPTKMFDISDEKIQEEVELKDKAIHKIMERSFYLWLYPNHKLTFKQVQELLKPYLENEEKASWLGDKLIEYIEKSKDIRDTYIEEQKNLKALANKKN